MFVERSTQYTSFSSTKQPANAGMERKQFTENASVALQQPILTHAHTKCPPVAHTRIGNVWEYPQGTDHTRTFENDRARCTLLCKLNSMSMLQTQAPAITSGSGISYFLLGWDAGILREK